MISSGWRRPWSTAQNHCIPSFSRSRIDSQSTSFSKRDSVGCEASGQLHPLHHGSHRGIVTKVGRVVGVLVSGNDLVDPLPKQTEYVVGDVAPVAIVAHELAQPLREPEPLVELAHQHQPRLAGDLATLEVDRKFPLENEAGSTMTLRSHRHPSPALPV